MITVNLTNLVSPTLVHQYDVAVPAQLFDIFSEDVSHPKIIIFLILKEF
jgi:hypothetical protein